MDNQSYMKEKRVLPLVVTMSLPMVISMLVNSLYNIVDSYFVAQVSESAMTALSLAFPLQNMISATGVGFGVGINAAVSYFLGAKMREQADRSATLGLLLAAAHGFVLFGAPLASFIYRDVEVGEYVRILGFVAPFMYLESMVDGVLKGLGEQLATFRYSLLDSILRITAIWFVVPKYGMMGFLGVMVVSNLMTFCLNMKRMMEQIKKPSPDGGRWPKAG